MTDDHETLAQGLVEEVEDINHVSDASVENVHENGAVVTFRVEGDSLPPGLLVAVAEYGHLTVDRISPDREHLELTTHI